MSFEKRIEHMDEILHRADTDSDARKSIGGLIIVCGHLMEIIRDQQKRIERLEDALQNHLETTPRRQ